MSVFKKINNEDINTDINEIELKIKQNKFKINEYEQNIKMLQRDILNLGYDYEMLRLLKLKFDNSERGNEYKDPAELKEILQYMLRTSDSYEKLNEKKQPVINALTYRKPPFSKWENL